MPERYDVFLSHNSREKPVVERLAHKLKQANLEPWFDQWCLTPGRRWQEELVAGLETLVILCGVHRSTRCGRLGERGVECRPHASREETVIYVFSWRYFRC